MAGIQSVPRAGQIGYRPNNPQPSIFDAYGAAVNAQGSDYDRLMGGYKEQGNQAPIAPIGYSGSPDVTNALGMFKNFSETGGYSDADVNALRERSISPIRSIYSNAKMNLDRNKTISGGYSPGYAGAIAKMAREQSNIISNKTNDANAGIAQMVQAGKLAGMGGYSNLASSEAGRGLDVSKFNANLEGDNRNRSLDILKSQSGLYGTSPGMVGTLGNQALNTANLNQNDVHFQQDRVDRNRLAQLTTMGRL